MDEVNVLFVDMNAFFASVEQQMTSRLRGRPVAVAAVVVDSTCCIAASYEARRFGIKTGTSVRQARQLCPWLEVVEARPSLYVEKQREILAAVERCIPVSQVESIDELHCRLLGSERRSERALAIAREIKQEIARTVGRWLRCSIGVAPNRLLAKIASDLRKPDGLTLLLKRDLPESLYAMALRDLPGIGPGMEARLHGRGVRTVEQLYRLTEAQMAEVWGGVVGRRWWHWLRGVDLPEPGTRRRSLGHSHVLPPDLRSEEGARAVLVKLIHRAAARLRRTEHWARRMRVYLAYGHEEQGWAADVSLGCCQDTQTMLEALAALWPHRPPLGAPKHVAVDLYDLVARHNVEPPLFPEAQRRMKLAHAMDAVTGHFGAGAVYFGSMHTARGSAPTRIGFTKIPETADFGFDRDEPETGAAGFLKRSSAPWWAH